MFPANSGFVSLTSKFLILWGAPEVPLRLINVQLRTVLAVGGVGGLAVGLALQNLVQNLISGPPGKTWPGGQGLPHPKIGDS